MFDKYEDCASSFGLKTLGLIKEDYPNVKTGNIRLLVKRGRQLNAFDIVHF